jgi:phosphate/sulfate permease
MHISVKDAWTILHGMTFGALFLIAFAGGFEALLSLRPSLVTADGVVEKLKRLSLGTWAMAAVAWATVITGTWIPYVWYRDKAPTSPRSTLLADHATAGWHEFGMEWKEHVAWLAPIFATVVAYLVYYYGRRFVKEEKMRRYAMVVFSVAFATAAVAGMFGALINKAAPTR